mmetsp:Transcript_8119/g.11616  ORF Transcript_8119/g.11616 Transcript_8119/m.11616 type:complete len:494 (-) Transcript_8119:341-1822(-)
MKFSFFSSATALSALIATVSIVKGDDVLQIHGSGTTNPTKCIWLIMQDFMERTKLPTKFTYRGVGSSTGQFEFMGTNHTGDFAYVPWNYFGSGDIPFSQENYELLNSNGDEFYQMPFVMGAISVFHNIPGVPGGAGGLKLTPCALAKIFRAQIQYWDDPEIVSLNDHIASTLKEKKLPIKVARRVLGSSSTATFTQYLHESTQLDCPDTWPKVTSSGEKLVGKVIDWDDTTLPCQGSGGVTDCIRDNEGAIGYIDAGHGNDEGLAEIELRNLAGIYQSSREAAEAGVAAAAGDTLPSRADGDFSGVQLLNQPGEATWPMVAMSYFYVRKDLSYIPNVAERSLLLEFLGAFYDPDVIDECRQFGFVPVGATVNAIAKEALSELKDSLPADAPTWTYEVDTIKGGGQEDYVISSKRRTYAEYERTSLLQDQMALMARVAEMEATMKVNALVSDDKVVYTQSEADRITAALALSSLSIVLWGVAILYLLAKKLCGI